MTNVPKQLERTIKYKPYKIAALILLGIAALITGIVVIGNPHNHFALFVLGLQIGMLVSSYEIWFLFRDPD